MSKISYLEVESITTADEGVAIQLLKNPNIISITLVVSQEDRDDLARILKKMKSIKLDTPQTGPGSHEQITETLMPETPKS